MFTATLKHEDVRFLLSNRPEGMTAKHISKVISVSPAKVRKIINELRAQGVPIVANTSGDGYWISTSKEMVQAQIDSMQRRIREMGFAMNGLRRTIREGVVR